MQHLLQRRQFGAALIGGLLAPSQVPAAQIAVRYTEGLIRGYLSLRTLQGETLANGELKQVSRGGRVTSRVAFQFKDGSLHEETAVFTQQRSFRLLSYRLVQKGPVFPMPIDMSIPSPAGPVTVRYTEEGKDKVETENKPLPADVANGMVLMLVKNIPPAATETVVSMVGATPKPRLVKLKITAIGKEPFSVGGLHREATHYVVKVDIGGITGLLATLLGKNPPDNHIWIIGGDTPGFAKAEGPLYLGGPPWRIEIASPAWPAAHP